MSHPSHRTWRFLGRGDEWIADGFVFLSSFGGFIMPRADSGLWTKCGETLCDVQQLNAEEFRTAVKNMVGNSGRVTRVKEVHIADKKVFTAWGCCRDCAACDTKFRFQGEDHHILWEKQGTCSPAPAEQAKQKHIDRLAHLPPMRAARNCCIQLLVKLVFLSQLVLGSALYCN